MIVCVVQFCLRLAHLRYTGVPNEQQVVNAADRTVIKGGGIAAAKEVGLPPRGPTMRTRTTGAFTAMSGADDVETATYDRCCAWFS